MPSRKPKKGAIAQEPEQSRLVLGIRVIGRGNTSGLISDGGRHQFEDTPQAVVATHFIRLSSDSQGCDQNQPRTARTVELQ